MQRAYFRGLLNRPPRFASMTGFSNSSAFFPSRGKGFATALEAAQAAIPAAPIVRATFVFLPIMDPPSSKHMYFFNYMIKVLDCQL